MEAEKKYKVGNSAQLTSALIPLLFIMIVFACKQSDPVLIGFVADLSSRNSVLGVQARNGFQMAVDEVNDAGGLNGFPVEVLIQNHEGDREICSLVVSDLVEKNIDVIIGPMLSGMASTVIDASGDSGTLIIAPTVSTDNLTGLDDMFLRIVTPASRLGSFIAKAVEIKGNSRIIIVMDRNNEAYTRGVAEGFYNEIGHLDSIMIDEIYFQDREDFPDTVERMESFSPDAIFIVASGIDAAAIIQQYAKNNEVPQLFSTSWSKVTSIIDYGGKILEGMIITDSYENKKPIDREIRFNRAFEQRYGLEPNFSAKMAYESVHMYVSAVELSSGISGREVKSSILNMESIEGVSDEFMLDQYGDAMRGQSYYIVKNGEFVLMDGIE